MPRLENVGPNVDQWYNTIARGDGSSTYDVCSRCAAALDKDPHAFDRSLVPYGYKEPQGQDGWAGDVSHPEYDDQHPPYKCAVCRRALSDSHDA